MWTCKHCGETNQEPQPFEQEVTCLTCGTISIWCDKCGSFMEHDEKFGCLTCFEFNTDPVIWGDVPWWMTDKAAF